ncbi:MAG: chemotaxis-specific protein-glutamate methyltransferase CheB [Rubritepida sp.]|nr:chemotaxis-specific protein-glutamate methyltransferase CheB [Rubritepida sp.]
MLCDDSAVVRGALARLLESDPAIRIVARVGNGRAALDAMERAAPADRAEVILLDLEMPVMDGMTALPLLLKSQPRPVVIVASALTQRGASQTMAAMGAGASDYIPKPSAAHGAAQGGAGGGGTGGMADPAFRAELLAKVKGWGRVRAKPATVPGTGPGPAPGTAPAVALTVRPRAIAIASSTGGPQALASLIGKLPRNLAVPVLVTQHMPPGFTAMLAQHLDGLGGPRCAEAVAGELLRPGHVYVAPGDRHLVPRAGPGGPCVALTGDPPENYCRPAADPMLRALATLYGRDLLAVVLTGMGQDGLRGCRAVIAAGGEVIAQDEASSVVWGMPGAVAKAGLARIQAPPEALAGHLLAALNPMRARLSA